ncbi:MAG TPA: hypothetical protein ENK50_06275 [Sedimenticola sp.]|nr:hypothetical protein [Sedimenticola sp.]
MNEPFPEQPAITLYDPLAEVLGVGDGRFRYRFDDVVKLSGHACPTVAGAFLMAIQGLQALYGETMPVRGAVRVFVPGPVDSGVNGPVSQVFTLITGAASANGFHGLGGRFVRSGLLVFGGAGNAFRFQRVDNGEQIALTYDPEPIPADPALMPLMQQLLQGNADDRQRRQFAALWRQRVVDLLEDGGEHTVSASCC